MDQKELEKYVVYDGKHPIDIELEEAQKDGEVYSLIGKGSTHKLYKFPNGYGASIATGSFTFNLPELAMIKFDDMGSYSLVGDVERFYDEAELYRVIERIYLK